MNVQWLFYGNFIALINRWEKNHVDKVNNVKKEKKTLTLNTQHSAAVKVLHIYSYAYFY